MFGIDVYEGDGSVDWLEVKRSGKSFAFVKATEGRTIKDKLFPKHWVALKQAGLIRGAYHFSIQKLPIRLTKQRSFSKLWRS